MDATTVAGLFVLAADVEVGAGSSASSPDESRLSKTALAAATNGGRP